jgi:hypothetical protein
MKKLLFATSLILMIGSNLEAQEIDSRLLEKYKKSEIKNLSSIINNLIVNKLINI